MTESRGPAGLGKMLLELKDLLAPSGPAAGDGLAAGLAVWREEMDRAWRRAGPSLTPSEREDLVRLVRAAGDFCVGVAAFPEGHVRSASEELDLSHFVAKCQAGASFAITQMFFFTDDFLRFRDQVAARGCDVPIIAGIMPITSVPMIDRAVLLSGARFPADLAKDLHEHQSDRAAVRKIGVEYAAGMCQRLLDAGVAGLHFYTLNGSRATGEIYQMLGLADEGPVSAAIGSRSGSTAPMTA